MDSIIWNPWHGCHKYSEGCRNCYVFRRDASVGRDADTVTKTASFDLPVQTVRGRGYRIPSGRLVYCCMTSDFFLEDADKWRDELWQMMRLRRDLRFFIITKRVLRIRECLPPDWGDGYGNVTILCTVESQQQANLRLPEFLDLPIRHKRIVCEPLLTPIDLTPYLCRCIESVTVGGESGPDARICDYAWVLDLREQCVRADVPFCFKQTGANFVKDGKLYRIPRKYQHAQARKSGISTAPLV